MEQFSQGSHASFLFEYCAFLTVFTTFPFLTLKMYFLTFWFHYHLIQCWLQVLTMFHIFKWRHRFKKARIVKVSDMPTKTMLVSITTCHQFIGLIILKGMMWIWPEWIWYKFLSCVGYGSGFIYFAEKLQHINLNQCGS